jgi:hypothetical protein
MVRVRATGSYFLVTHVSRFHRSRHHLRRDYPDGKGRRRENGHRRELRATYTVSPTYQETLPDD